MSVAYAVGKTDLAVLVKAKMVAIALPFGGQLTRHPRLNPCLDRAAIFVADCL